MPSWDLAVLHMLIRIGNRVSRLPGFGPALAHYHCRSFWGYREDAERTSSLAALQLMRRASGAWPLKCKNRPPNDSPTELSMNMVAQITASPIIPNCGVFLAILDPSAWWSRQLRVSVLATSIRRPKKWAATSCQMLDLNPDSTHLWLARVFSQAFRNHAQVLSVLSRL